MKTFFKVLFSVRLLLNDSIQVELILFTVLYLLRFSIIAQVIYRDARVLIGRGLRHI